MGEEGGAKRKPLQAPSHSSTYKNLSCTSRTVYSAHEHTRTNEELRCDSGIASLSLLIGLVVLSRRALLKRGITRRVVRRVGLQATAHVRGTLTRVVAVVHVTVPIVLDGAAAVAATVVWGVVGGMVGLRVVLPLGAVEARHAAKLAAVRQGTLVPMHVVVHWRVVRRLRRIPLVLLLR